MKGKILVPVGNGWMRALNQQFLLRSDISALWMERLYVRMGGIGSLAVEKIVPINP